MLTILPVRVGAFEAAGVLPERVRFRLLAMPVMLSPVDVRLALVLLARFQLEPMFGGLAQAGLPAELFDVVTNLVMLSTFWWFDRIPKYMLPHVVPDHLRVK